MSRERNIIEIEAPNRKKFWACKKEVENIINRINSKYKLIKQDFNTTKAHDLVLQINGIVVAKEKVVELKQYLKLEYPTSWFIKFFQSIEDGETIEIKKWKFKQG